MFIRIKESKNSPKKAVQIVESYRNEDNKPRQKIVRHVGTAFSDSELARMLDLAEFIKAELETEKTPGLFKPQELAEMAIEAVSLI